jgi:glycosyltransferase involved in cell wall biosynthesis
MLKLTTIHPFDPWGSKIGGIESAIRSMLQHAPQDFELSLIGVTEDPAQRPTGQWSTLEFRGRPIHFYPVFADQQPNKRNRIPLFLRFPLVLRFKHFDLQDHMVIYHRVEPIALSSLTAKSHILCVHGDPREIVSPRSEVRWRSVPWLYRMAEARAVRRSRFIYSVCREGVEYFQQNYPTHHDRTSFLSTWYCDDVFFPVSDHQREQNRQQFLKQHNLPDSTCLILFACRWEEQKDPILALQSFALAAAQNPDMRLVLAGGGGMRSRMEEAIGNLNISSKVCILGSLSAPDLANTLRISDVFLMSSNFEGMPIGVMEALACGLPVVSTDVGEICALVQHGETGLIINQRTPEQLSNALIDVVNNPQKFNRDACAISMQKYSPGAILPQFFKSLKELM